MAKKRRVPLINTGYCGNCGCGECQVRQAKERFKLSSRKASRAAAVQAMLRAKLVRAETLAVRLAQIADADLADYKAVEREYYREDAWEVNERPKPNKIVDRVKPRVVVGPAFGIRPNGTPVA